ncbi:MAG TPA: prepilin-type N-terminal cleavage/methylation domain-containing protein [Acidobacteriota bacterium]|nr:prepilin-type N-terminal cleavage/methylation domain-containing protein [Acidobacteriota bacterium]
MRERKVAQAGFTLLEVIVSFTIMALLSGVVFVGLRFALNAYDHAQERMEEAAVRRVLFARLKHQVASLYPATPRGAFVGEMEPGAEVQDPVRQALGAYRPLFFGTDDFVVFVSLVPLLGPDRPGVTVVRYGLAQNEQGGYYLGVMEVPYTGMASFERMVEAPYGVPYSLVEDVRNLEFEYYGFDPASSSYAWFTGWSGLDVGAAPEALQIRFDDHYVLLTIQCSYPFLEGRMPGTGLIGQ